jgi:hypothetical protein
MAFIALRRSRNTRSYYLVESYRDEAGWPRKRTLCYLGREQDGTDTLEKALAHWQAIATETARTLRSAPADRRPVLKNRVAKARQRIALLTHHLGEAARVEEQLRERERHRLAEEEARRRRAEEAEHWQAIERLQRQPSAENAQAAKQAFRVLALRLHPDQGGSHDAFIRLKSAYDRAEAGWRRRAG